MNKLKLARELNALVEQVKSGELTGLNKVRVPRRINAIIIELGGQVAAAADNTAAALNPDGLSDTTTDENYRWRDTAYIAGARKFLSATFADAKKEGRNVNINDIDWQEIEKDMRLAQSLVNKANVFGVVDWAGLREAGMPSNVAYLIKRVYTAVGKEPLVPTNSDSMRNYVRGISVLRETLEKCRSYEDIEDALVSIGKMCLRPKYAIEYYKNPAIADSYGPAGILENRCMAELGESFRSWIFKTGNKALSECRRNKNPDTYHESKGATWDWANLEPKVKDEEGKEVKPKKATFQLEHASDIERTGGTEIDLQSSKQLEEIFGFRGIQSGNWVLKDKSSAEFHMKATAEAMLDMSDVLGIDAKHLGLGGNLALAFGARGKGGALAHYESSTKVINITKMKGGGSLGHEYFHAIDNLIADLIGETGKDIRFFASTDYNQIQDEELRAAFEGLNEALTVRKDLFAYKSQYVDLSLETQTERTIEWINQNAQQMPRLLNLSMDEANALSLAELSIRFQNWAEDFQRRNERMNVRNVAERHLGDYLLQRHFSVQDVPVNTDGEVEMPLTGAKSTSQFKRSAMFLDGGGKKSYWAKDYEMAARAFSAYLQDRLAEQGRKNDYLAYATQGGNGRIGEVAYPQGKERETVNAAFDELFRVIRTKEILKKASENQALLDSIFGGTPELYDESAAYDDFFADVQKELEDEEMQSGMLDSSNSSDATQACANYLKSQLVEKGWIIGEKGIYSNADEEFQVRINQRRLYTFDIEIYQGPKFIQCVTENGIFIQDCVDFINAFIVKTENKLEYMAELKADPELNPDDLAAAANTVNVIQITDAIAQGAATSQLNEGENPTQQQLIANDYKTAKVNIAGLSIAIENPIGSIRSGTDEAGNAWETQMTAHYGFIETTLGADGDELDIFIASDVPHDFDGRVYVISQNDRNGRFDEHKVIIGVDNKTQAVELYRSHYDENFNGVSAVHDLSLEDFKAKIYGGHTAMFDSIQGAMLDSWLNDGSFDLLPIKRLKLDNLDDGSKDAKPTLREPIVVIEQGNNFNVVHGRKRYEQALKNGEKLIPAIVFDGEHIPTLSEVKQARQKCGNAVHSEAFAVILEELAADRAEAALS
ncbi:LPD1 domain-containing protein [Acinetobacter sp. ANC 3813]|uniref:LPD1 domain-containing protein n=1 Tax=Acinetobacter sp. ANC 3813 TaxID=1977873 RepID=UPI000A33E2B5|nr:LPD1 domain-containing protein [Acinetobacter sp. ANC 3813]OTG87871.1 hypothetical protein B9T34_16170 [Acinetobacter sp. ANC 3813]